ncbi:MAG: hypothetical protein IKG55_01700, partial [Solobacterium sp.]|nr:hypothetical protein [Solobacterium sp.]
MFGKCLDEDLERIAQNRSYDELYGSSVLITGATGLIGLSLARLFIFMNENYKADITMHLLIRSREKLNSLLGEYAEKKYIHAHTGDIISFTSLEEDIDYVFHCASITNSKMM